MPGLLADVQLFVVPEIACGGVLSLYPVSCVNSACMLAFHLGSALSWPRQLFQADAVL